MTTLPPAFADKLSASITRAHEKACAPIPLVSLPDMETTERLAKWAAEGREIMGEERWAELGGDDL